MGILGDLNHHIVQRFNTDLEDLRHHVLTMGGLVEHQLDGALTALTTGDGELGEAVARADYRVNAMEVAIDERCARLIALRQPAATDMRLVLTVSKTIADLERIGDESKRVALMAVRITASGEDFAQREASRLGLMGVSVKRQLHGALDAFARVDAEAALEVIRNDAAIDQEHDEVQRRVLCRMSAVPADIDRLMGICWAARALERIGDHAKNVAEYVVYLVYGKDIRHTHPTPRETPAPVTSPGHR
ncbi:MAG: phosphate signaling complex protein PhoU [Gammaproteobacteria bacterium]|nr:phosphate signaling complex protein PhoU [Gammaproteobacteria bacterium]